MQVNTMDHILETAMRGHGIELQPYTVRRLASTLVSIDREMVRLTNLEHILAAYINEYGGELAAEFQTMEAMIAEVLDGNEFEGEGQEDDDEGLYAPLAEGSESSVEVFETDDEG